MAWGGKTNLERPVGVGGGAGRRHLFQEGVVMQVVG